MLHYRNTGEYGQALWNGAVERADDGAKAYALGYLTHIATDVTGHAVVNAIAGGPFRLHWQRQHHPGRNNLDSLWRLTIRLRPGSPFSNRAADRVGALYFDIAFAGADHKGVPRPPYPTGDTLRERYVRRRTLDIDSELPEGISELLIKAMEDVYKRGTPSTNPAR